MAGRTYSFGTGGWECYLSRFNGNGDTLWTRTFGNVLYDEFQDVDTTSDGGFIAVGHTTTTDWSGNVYLIRTNSNGTLLWSKEYGGAVGLSDKGYSVRETSDGGFIISGTTATYGAGGDDMYVLKVNSTGTIVWSTTIGSAGVNEAGREVQQTNDGGYIVAGYTDGLGTSFYDVYLVKLNASGVVQWKKTYGGSSYDFAYTVHQTADNGFIIGATTNSFGAGDYNAYLLKTDVNGTLQWSKTYGKTGEDRIQCARQTSDGGYILCGRSNSFGAGNFDATLHKTDASGNLLWTKGYGGSGDDQAYYARETAPNAFVFCGYTVSFGAGIKDALLVKTDANGTSGCNEITATGFITSSVTSLTSTVGTSSTGGTLISPSTAVRNTNSAKNVLCSSNVGCTVSSNFTASSTAICLNGTINFTNTSVGATSQNWLVNGTVFSSSVNATRTFPSAGTYEIKLISSNGPCSDTNSLTITVSSPSAASISNTACQSYTWPVNGQTYTQSGTYTATIPNAAGCDSVITLNLTIGQPTNSTETISNCGNYLWAANGQTYTQSGTYTSTFTNAQGCVSTQTLDLTIHQPSASTLTETALNSYILNGQTYTQSGTYNQIIPNSVGCDSTITLNLTLSFTDVIELRANIRMYPNPTYNELTIERSSSSNCKYFLMDGQGRLVQEGELSGTVSQLSLGALNSGIYMLFLEKQMVPIQVFKE